MYTPPTAVAVPLPGPSRASLDFFRSTLALTVVVAFLHATPARAQTVTVLKDFLTEGQYPQSAVIQASDGNFYGTTLLGGKSGHGTVYKIDSAGAMTVLHEFSGSLSSDGGNPYASLIQGVDGYLYGTTSYGTLFKIDTSGTSFTTLNSSLSTPYSGVIQGTDGRLYGTTSAGGSGNVGTVYVINSDGTGFTTLHSLTVAEGTSPQAGVIQASDGSLYGATTGGGANGNGTIFKLSTDGLGFIVLHSFLQASDGASPYASLVQATDGKLYGTTINGGTNGDGTVFSMTTAGLLTTLHHFTGFDGQTPRAPMIQAADGNLYGTTFSGGSVYGTIFKVDALSGGVTTVHAFANSDGANPNAGVSQGTDGNLYGTTTTGLTNKQYGTAYRIATDGTGIVTLHTFTPFPDGLESYAGLIRGSDGNLYGITNRGGANNFGVIFRLGSDGSGFTKLHDFTYSDGAYAEGSLIQGADGNFYGTTKSGGGSNQGLVFRIDPSGVSYAVLHYFTGTGSDGAAPSAGVIQGTDGKLYGTTQNGGTHVNYGTVYRINTDGTKFKTLHSFAGSDGGNPYGRLIQASDGFLYGMTAFGGANGYGAIFKIDAAGTTFTKLHDFNTTDGANPRAFLLEGADGKLYGPTDVGGSNFVGTIFRMDASGANFETLHVCSSSEGAGPSGLIQGSDGTLYGTMQVGGGGTCASGCGTIFQIDTDGTTFTTLHHFETGEGVGPKGNLLQALDGTLYGTTAFGGAANGGTVYKLGCTPPTAVASGSASICPGVSTPLSGSGGVSCSWSPATGLSDPESCSPTATPSQTTDYTLTVVDAGGCASTNEPTVTVTVNPMSDATITTAAAVCPSTSGHIASVPDPGSGATYVWTITNGTIDAGAGTSSIQWSSGVASPVTLKVKVTNSSGCKASKSKNVPNIVPSAAITAPSAVCAKSTGNAASVPNAGPGATYTWIITNGTITSGSGTRSIRFTAGDSGSVSLSVSVVNAAGCASSGSKTIPIQPSPNATITAPSSVCPNSTGNAASAPSGAAAYNWTVTNGTLISGQGTHMITFTAGASGSVTLKVTVTGNNGCASTKSKSVPIHC